MSYFGQIRPDSGSDRRDANRSERSKASRAQAQDLAQILEQSGSKIQDALASRVRTSQMMSLKMHAQLTQMRFTNAQMLKNTLPKGMAEQLSKAAETARSHGEQSLPLTEGQRRAYANALTKNQLNNTSMKMAWQLLSPRARAAILDSAVKHTPESSRTFTPPKSGQPPTADPMTAKNTLAELLARGTLNQKLQQNFSQRTAKNAPTLNPGQLKFAAKSPTKEGPPLPKDATKQAFQLRVKLMGLKGPDAQKHAAFLSMCQQAIARGYIGNGAENRFSVPLRNPAPNAREVTVGELAKSKEDGKKTKDKTQGDSGGSAVSSEDMRIVRRGFNSDMGPA